MPSSERYFPFNPMGEYQSYVTVVYDRILNEYQIRSAGSEVAACFGDIGTAYDYATRNYLLSRIRPEIGSNNYNFLHTGDFDRVYDYENAQAEPVETGVALPLQPPLPTSPPSSSFTPTEEEGVFITDYPPLIPPLGRGEFPSPPGPDQNTVYVFYRSDTDRFYVSFRGAITRYRTMHGVRGKILSIGASNSAREHIRLYPEDLNMFDRVRLRPPVSDGQTGSPRRAMVSITPSLTTRPVLTSRGTIYVWYDLHSNTYRILSRGTEYAHESWRATNAVVASLIAEYNIRRETCTVEPSTASLWTELQNIPETLARMPYPSPIVDRFYYCNYVRTPTSRLPLATIKQHIADIVAAPASSRSAQRFRHIIMHFAELLAKKADPIAEQYSVIPIEIMQDAQRRVAEILRTKSGVNFITENTITPLTVLHPDIVQFYTIDDNIYALSQDNIDEFMGSCRTCRTIQFSDRFSWSEDNEGNDRPYCASCFRSYQRNGAGNVSKVWNYGKNVRECVPSLFKVDETSKARKEGISQQKGKTGKYLYFGVELEVLPRGSDMLDAVHKNVGESLDGFAIMKNDSSLSDGGFEIVTAPATLEYHRKKGWSKFFTENSRGIIPAKLVKSWTTTCCGTHVHFTKAALTPIQLSKVLVFFHEPENNEFLSKIAGREVGPRARYCNTSKKRIAGKIRMANGKRVIENRTAAECSDHHYAACVSQRNNGETVEVRIFRGNATRHGIMRSIEFVAAIVDWCGDNSANDINKYIKFLAWFDKEENRGRYKQLWRHLIQLGYIRTTHVSEGKKVLQPLPDDEQAA